MDAIVAEPGPRVYLPLQLVGLADQRRRGHPQTGLAVAARQAGVGGERQMFARRPVAVADRGPPAERVREVGGKLPASTGARESRQEPAGDRARVETTALGVAERVFGERGRRDAGQQRIRVAEGGIESPEQGKPRSLAPPGRRRLDGAPEVRGAQRAADRLVLDLPRKVEDVRIQDPALAGRAKSGSDSPSNSSQKRSA